MPVIRLKRGQSVPEEKPKVAAEKPKPEPIQKVNKKKGWFKKSTTARKR